MITCAYVYDCVCPKKYYNMYIWNYVSMYLCALSQHICHVSVHLYILLYSNSLCITNTNSSASTKHWYCKSPSLLSSSVSGIPNWRFNRCTHGCLMPTTTQQLKWLRDYQKKPAPKAMSLILEIGNWRTETKTYTYNFLPAWELLTI